MNYSLIYYVGDDPADFHVIEGSATELRFTGGLLMSSVRVIRQCDLILNGRRVETCNARGHWNAAVNDPKQEASET